MRKCVGLLVMALVFLFLADSGQLSAQGLFFGAGGTFPTGDYGEYADAGWMVDAGVNIPLGENGLYLYADGMYGSNSHSDIDGDKTNLLGGFGGVEYVLQTEGMGNPFVFGQVGFLRHEYQSDEFSEFEDSETGLAFGGGVGYSFPLSDSFNGWILGRYIQGQFDGEDGNTTFFGVTAGVSIPLGGS